MQNSAERMFDVVVNSQGQYSLWAVNKEMPRGWNATGIRGDKQHALSYIGRVWKDIAPLDVRPPCEGSQELSSQGKES